MIDLGKGPILNMASTSFAMHSAQSGTLAHRTFALRRLGQQRYDAEPNLRRPHEPTLTTIEEVGARLHRLRR
eukprot:5898180-Pyramimonas_sp.AAC.1